MKTSARKSRKGYTLIELSVAIGFGLVVSAMVLAMVNQQFAFLRLYQSQSFLMEEAPLISTHMNRLIGQAERFRLHQSKDDALAGANPVMSDAPVLVLNFQQPDGTTKAAMLAFEDLGNGPALYYYLVPTAGALAAPQWAITRKANDVQFSIQNGVLRMQLTGPSGEQITYSGVMQQ
jgi:hypothetical protein